MVTMIELTWTRATISILTLLVSSAPIAGLAQTTLRVDVELVNIVATVTDEDDRYITGLSLDDFIITDDGLP